MGDRDQASSWAARPRAARRPLRAGAARTPPHRTPSRDRTGRPGVCQAAAAPPGSLRSAPRRAGGSGGLHHRHAGPADTTLPGLYSLVAVRPGSAESRTKRHVRMRRPERRGGRGRNRGIRAVAASGPAAGRSSRSHGAPTAFSGSATCPTRSKGSTAVLMSRESKSSQLSVFLWSLQRSSSGVGRLSRGRTTGDPLQTPAVRPGTPCVRIDGAFGGACLRGYPRVAARLAVLSSRSRGAPASRAVASWRAAREPPHTKPGANRSRSARRSPRSDP